MKGRRANSKHLDWYITGAVMPYVILALLMFSAVLYAQQSSRFAELLLIARLPSSIALGIALNLLPTIVGFAVPTAMLTGMLIGFSRMGGDSEVIAMRAAGVGTWNIVRAPLVLGALTSLGMLYLGMEAAPHSAEKLRRTALQIALYKLDSPVDPKTFNTELPGKIIYVREGDQEKGEWGKVFIYSEDKNGETTYLTARAGRIDSAAEQSELVLSDAHRTVLPREAGKQSLVTEKLEQLRVRLPTGRSALLERLRRDEREPDEMSGRELWNLSETATNGERLEVRILLHRRLALACAPAIFALLGVGLGLRIKRGGRGLGIILSLAMLFLYYLLSLGGEQLARGRLLPPPLALWLANCFTLAIAYYFLVKNNASNAMLSLPRPLWRRRRAKQRQKESAARGENSTAPRRPAPSQRWGLLTLLDRNLLNSLAFYFFLAFLGFVALFMIFTVFELWKFVIKTGVGAPLVARYLFFLLPLTAVSLASTSTLVGVLATYALISRRSEALAWWASGQSAYRLAVPGIFFALWVGLGLWGVQERMMPVANQKQDALRAQIRSGIARTSAPVGRQWLASADGRRIYHFEFDEARGLLLGPVIYEFDAEGVHISRILEGETALWDAGQPDRLILRRASEFGLEGGGKKDSAEQIVLSGVESREVFKPGLNKPSQMSAAQLRDYIKLLNARGVVAADLRVALAKKQIEPYSPVVMALIGIPLALAFGRRSAVAALASAILIGLSFWGVSGGFQQLGAYGLLPARAAAWSPAVIFSTLGIYLLSRIRT